jgi:hypothetical protein
MRTWPPPLVGRAQPGPQGRRRSTLIEEVPDEDTGDVRGAGPVEQRGTLQEQVDRIGHGILGGEGEGHRVDVVGHHSGCTRVNGRDAGHPAPAAQVQDRLPADPGGLGLHDTGQQLGRRPDGRPEGDRLLGPTLLLPGLPQGKHVWGVMGHEVGAPGHRGQRGQPREQCRRGDRDRPAHSERGIGHRGGLSLRGRARLAHGTALVAQRLGACLVPLSGVCAFSWHSMTRKVSAANAAKPVMNSFTYMRSEADRS